MPVPALARSRGMRWGRTVYSRLSVLLGLLLLCPLPLPVGMPSRIPFSSPNDMLLRLGSGKLESGPARPCNASNEERRATLMACGVPVPEPESEPEEGDEAKGSRSVREREGELRIPGGYGRGPRRMVFSSVASWACWCRILCLRVEMFWRMATMGVRFGS